MGKRRKAESGVGNANCLTFFSQHFACNFEEAGFNVGASELLRPPAHGRTGHLVSGPRPRRRWTVTTATTDAGGAGPGRGGRASRPRRREAVPRLPRGGDPGTVARAPGPGVAAAAPAGRRGALPAGGGAAL